MTLHRVIVKGVMRKEVIIAIIIGSLLGLLITAGVWWTMRSPQVVSERQENLSISPSPSPKISSAPQDSLFLEISQPEEGDIFDHEEIKVNGKTLPEAVIVLIYSEGESIINAGKEGNFEATVSLSGGANQIKITAYDQLGNQKTKNLTVVYSTAKL